ncbi:hypothetical protein VCHA50P416_250054 [Vibrio chagasii]|nr:hypothetical protein VCHA42P256_250003 [Vibrio chagasii]CAH7123811.1 hypothetical protein VCHA43P272_260003 [Vibrio chagasii]CAH7321037.1 hypothetical protein VCHA50P416_250054 [Vibrio chagasii]
MVEICGKDGELANAEKLTALNATVRAREVANIFGTNFMGGDLC